jgi:hypothetical protein
MVLLFSISDTRLCQTFKLFFKKGRGVRKTTNPPPAIIHMETRENTYPQTQTYHIRSILQGENDLARIGLLE